MSALASKVKGTEIDPRLRQGNFLCPTTLSFVSFAGMTRKECAVLRIGTLTGAPCAGTVNPVPVKNPTVIRNGFL